MKSWALTMAAGVAALIGGLVALINPAAAGVATTTIVGWALLIAAAFQVWIAIYGASNGERVRGGAIAAAAAFLGLSLLFEPFGSDVLLRWLVGLLLIASGAAKIYTAARIMAGSQNAMLVYGAAAVSGFLGMLVLSGFGIDLGTLLGIELLASGLSLVLLGMDRRSHNV